MLRLLKRIATTRVGVSPSSDDFAVAAKGLRYARIALAARTTTDEKVITFDNSVLGVGAVSAPEVTARLAEVVLTGFDGLSPRRACGVVRDVPGLGRHWRFGGTDRNRAGVPPEHPS